MRAALSTGTALASGPVSLTDFSTERSDKPVYLAFYYNSPQNLLKPRQWNITNLTIVNNLADGWVSSIIAVPIANAGFKFVEVQNPTMQWGIIGTSLVMLAGPIGEPTNEDWAIFGPVNLNKVAVPDVGSPLKGTADALNSEYIYTYTKPGTYKATFVAANSNLNETKAVIKELTIKIEP